MEWNNIQNSSQTQTSVSSSGTKPGSVSEAQMEPGALVLREKQHSEHAAFSRDGVLFSGVSLDVRHVQVWLAFMNPWKIQKMLSTFIFLEAECAKKNPVQTW